MKKYLLLLLLLLPCVLAFAQNKEAAGKLVAEGVALHDQRQYDKAIATYDEALALDKANPLALSEKALTLQASGKYEEAVRICREVIDRHPVYEGLNTVYVTYGNALDALRRHEEALKVYDEGIGQFPNYYQLYFNKGVTLSLDHQYDEAMEAFQKAVTLNPQHASSHNAIARLADMNDQRIPALLALCRFMVLDSEGKRAEENLERIKNIMNRNVKRTGDSSVTIYIDSKTLGDAGRRRKKKADDFSTTDMILSMTTALDYDGKYKDELPVERFARKFKSVCASLSESKSSNRGFFRTYYAPYFAEIGHKDMVDVFAHIAMACTGDARVLQWLGDHKAETDKFVDWSRGFVWK